MKSQNRTIASSVLHVLKQSLRPLLVGAALLGAQFVTATPTLAQDSTVTKAKNASGYFGATVKLSATLQRSKDKAYLSGLSLTFKIDVVAVGAPSTDTAGKATLDYKIEDTLTTGDHVFTAEFAGDTANKASMGTAKLTTVLTHVQLNTFHGAQKAGGTIPLKARLTRRPDKKLLANKTVHWLLAGNLIGSAMTNSDGIAELDYKIPANTAPGVYQMSLVFDGDSQYAAETNATSTLKVN